jgi:hypothetical protein
MIDQGLDPIGLMLGFGEQAYHRFTTPLGVKGLARWTDDRLDILAVESEVEGTGRFRYFISQSKLVFHTICLWEVWNPLLEQALVRYGFSPETEVLGDGEVVHGMRWDQPK